jgi:hypothetical protein
MASAAAFLVAVIYVPPVVFAGSFIAVVMMVSVHLGAEALLSF